MFNIKGVGTYRGFGSFSICTSPTQMFYSFLSYLKGKAEIKKRTKCYLSSHFFILFHYFKLMEIIPDIFIILFLHIFIQSLPDSILIRFHFFPDYL